MANETMGGNVTTSATDSENGGQGPGQPPRVPWSITKPGYDIRQPPRDPATNKPVLVQMMAFSNYIETINEQDGEMVVAYFMLASWRDSRVRALSDILQGLPGYRRDMLPMAGQLKQQLWVPDLYMPMARRVTIPTIHQPAESVSVLAAGTIQYSVLFVIALKCQLAYSNYPMDVQTCFLDVMSYKYSVDEMRMHWHPDSLQGNTKIVTKHFHVTVTLPKVNSSFVLHNPDGSSRDVLRLKIVLQRHLTFHLLQTYLPSTLLVFIGWLSLLVPLDFAYGRMVLSVSTLLVLVTIFVTNSQMAPGVNEVKALDIWLFTCIFFVFSAIVDCIADLRFLSMVEKESQLGGEEAAADRRQRGRHGPPPAAAARSYSVTFHGDNTPFQSDKEVLIATPAVIKWLRMAVFLERSMTVVYPTLFVLFVAVYWSIFLAAYFARSPETE